MALSFKISLEKQLEGKKNHNNLDVEWGVFFTEIENYALFSPSDDAGPREEKDGIFQSG